MFTGRELLRCMGCRGRHETVNESRDHFHVQEIAGFVAVLCGITLIPDYWFNLLAAAAGHGCQATNARVVSYSVRTHLAKLIYSL